VDLDDQRHYSLRLLLVVGEIHGKSPVQADCSDSLRASRKEVISTFTSSHVLLI